MESDKVPRSIDRFVIWTTPATLELKKKWDEFVQQVFLDDLATGTLLRSCELVASDGNAIYFQAGSIFIGQLNTKEHSDRITKMVPVLLGPSFRLNFIEPSGVWVSIPKRENKTV